MDWRTGRTTESWMGWTRVDGAYGADKADWADRLGCGHPGRLASSHLRAEGIPRVLSLDANCRVI